MWHGAWESSPHEVKCTHWVAARAAKEGHAKQQAIPDEKGNTKAHVLPQGMWLLVCAKQERRKVSC
jgi:hypothetical protein